MLKRIAAVLASLLVATAAHAQDKPRQPDPVAIQRIFSCMAVGLPKHWHAAWVVVHELGDKGGDRSFQADFRYSTAPGDTQGKPLHPCDAKRLARDVYQLNDYLTPAQRDWRAAELKFTRQGEGASYQLDYKYAPSGEGSSGKRSK